MYFDHFNPFEQIWIQSRQFFIFFIRGANEIKDTKRGGKF